MQLTCSLWRLIDRVGLCFVSTAGGAKRRKSMDAAMGTIAHANLSLEQGRGTVYYTEGTAVRSPAALTQSRRLGWRSERSLHRWATFGGARIGTVRVRMSMTSIGAPQWRQMKVGRSTVTASCGEGLSLGATPSNMRIRVRLARRTGLASNP